MAKMSGSASLCAIVVTAAVHVLSFHLLSNSHFFTSQHSTSSSAPTMALPAPEERFEAVPALSSGVQTAFEVPDVTTPKVFECSYFLDLSASRPQGYSEKRVTHSQIRFDHWGGSVDYDATLRVVLLSQSKIQTHHGHKHQQQAIAGKQFLSAASSALRTAAWMPRVPVLRTQMGYQ